MTPPLPERVRSVVLHPRTLRLLLRAAPVAEGRELVHAYGGIGIEDDPAMAEGQAVLLDGERNVIGVLDLRRKAAP